MKLKRKKGWARRFAKISDNFFSYRKTHFEFDREVRFSIDLAQCRVKFSERDALLNGEQYIMIEVPGNLESVLINFSNVKEYEKWVDAFKGFPS